MNTLVNTNGFESAQFNALMNVANTWCKNFNNVVVYEGKEVLAASAQIGFPEFGSVVNFRKINKCIELEIRFVGDNGIWNEWVDVKNVQNTPFCGVNF